jgi:hypothetical protein
MIDPANRVVALCAEGMSREGAHYLARHQPTPKDTLHWNALAVRHAERVSDGRAAELLASLYLNLADAHEKVGECAIPSASH